MNQFNLHHSKLFSLMTALCLLISACSLPTSAVPSVSSSLLTWIDQPRDGSTIPLAPMPVIASARSSSTGTVERIEILINEVSIGSAPLDQTQSPAQAQVSWNPSAPGEYAIQSRAFDQSGVSVLSAVSHVCVAEASGQAAPGCPTVDTGTSKEPEAISTTAPQITNQPPAGNIEIKAGASPNPVFYGKCDKEPIRLNFEANPADASAAIEVTLFISLADGAGNRREAGVFAMAPNGSGGYSFSLEPGTLDPASYGTGAVNLFYSVKLMNSNKEFYASSAEYSIALQACQPALDPTLMPVVVPSYTPLPQPVLITPVPPAPIITVAPVTQPVEKPVSQASSKTVYYVTGCGENTLTVSARISDPANIHSVRIHWIYTGGSNNPGTEKIFEMNHTGKSAYFLTIMDPKLHTAYPNLNGGSGKIQYWIEAQYNNGTRISSDVGDVYVLYCPG